VLGNNTGNKVVRVWPISYQCVWVWIALHVHIQLTVSTVGDIVPLCFIKQMFILIYDCYSENRIILLFHFWNKNHKFYNNLTPTACKKRLLPLLLFSWTGIPIRWWLKQTAETCGRIE
jgi:hypothetical protein